MEGRFYCLDTLNALVFPLFTCTDLDALAGSVAYKHISTASDSDTAPVTIVTASMDRLDLFLPKAVENYRLSGHVTYTGNSSMESKQKKNTKKEKKANVSRVFDPSCHLTYFFLCQSSSRARLCLKVQNLSTIAMRMRIPRVQAIWTRTLYLRRDLQWLRLTR